MPIQNPDYQAGLDAVNAATNRLQAEVGELNDAVTAAQARVGSIAAKLAAAPSDADVAKAAADLQKHATFLGGVSDALDVVESTLSGVAADSADPAPTTDPVPVPDAPIT